MKFLHNLFFHAEDDGGGDGGGDVGTTSDFIVNPEGNFASDWRDSLGDDVKGSMEGINNFNDMVSEIHQYKSKPPTQVLGLADNDGILKDGWYEQFPELKENASMRNFKSVEGMAKSLVNANKMVGKKIAPGEFLSDEHKKEFYTSMGVPENIEGYALTKPEDHPEDMPYDQTQVDWFANKALEHNLTPEQAQGIRNDFYNLQKNAWENGTAGLDGEIAQQNEELRTEWGSNYDKNLEVGALALQKIEGFESAQELGLDKNPKFAKFMYELSQTMGEDTLIKVGSGDSAETIQTLKDQVAALQVHPGYMDPTHVEYPNIQRKIKGLFDKMYPKEN